MNDCVEREVDGKRRKEVGVQKRDIVEVRGRGRRKRK